LRRASLRPSRRPQIRPRPRFRGPNTSTAHQWPLVSHCRLDAACGVPPTLDPHTHDSCGKTIQMDPTRASKHAKTPWPPWAITSFFLLVQFV
jgi:hypothetical protein